MKAEEELPLSVELRQNKYLNNRVEQDHRFIKLLTKPGRGFHLFNTARRMLRRYEANTSRLSQKSGKVNIATRDSLGAFFSLKNSPSSPQSLKQRLSSKR